MRPCERPTPWGPEKPASGPGQAAVSLASSVSRNKGVWVSSHPWNRHTSGLNVSLTRSFLWLSFSPNRLGLPHDVPRPEWMTLDQGGEGGEENREVSSSRTSTRLQLWSLSPAPLWEVLQQREVDQSLTGQTHVDDAQLTQWDTCGHMRCRGPKGPMEGPTAPQTDRGATSQRKWPRAGGPHVSTPGKTHRVYAFEVQSLSGRGRQRHKVLGTRKEVKVICLYPPGPSLLLM